MTRVTSPLRSAAVAVLLAATSAFTLSLSNGFAADANPTQERADRFLLLVNSAYKSLVTLEGNAAERAAHAMWQREREASWQALFPDPLGRLVVGTEQNRLDALVRFFHARMKTGRR